MSLPLKKQGRRQNQHKHPDSSGVYNRLGLGLITRMESVKHTVDINMVKMALPRTPEEPSSATKGQQALGPS